MENVEGEEANWEREDWKKERREDMSDSLIVRKGTGRMLEGYLVV